MADSFVENIFCGSLQARIRNMQIDYNSATTDLLVQTNANIKLALQINDVNRQYGELKLATSQTGSQQLAKIASQAEQITALGQTVATQSQNIANMTSQASLQTSFSLLPKVDQQIALQYYNKYPTADITYSGRPVGTNKTNSPMDVRVWCLEGQNDKAILDVVKGITVMDFMKQNPNLTFHQACDRCLMTVKNKLDGMIRYNSDLSDYGDNEFWAFASETMILGTGDCEDKSIIDYCAWRAAGIPKELLRVTAGMTFSGDGHCTTFYLASDNKFHHVNSTTNYSANQNPVVLPLTGDNSEQLNIQYPWFSMTEDKSFSSFGTAEAKESFENAIADKFREFLKIGGN